MVQDLYNNAPCGYHSLDPDGTFVQINDTELTWLGYTRDEVVGRMKFSDILTTETRKHFHRIFSDLQRDRGWVRDPEFDLVRKDGTLLPALLSATAIRDEAGNYLMSRATVYDLTVASRPPKPWKLNVRGWLSVLERVPAYVVLIAPDCTIPYANREFISASVTRGAGAATNFCSGEKRPARPVSPGLKVQCSGGLGVGGP